MSNPTGDALLAIGIKDTQKLTRKQITQALRTGDGCARSRGKSSAPSVSSKNIRLVPSAAVSEVIA